MNVSEHINQRQLQDILTKVYQKGQREADSLKVTDLIEEIKQQLTATMEPMK